MNTSIFDGVLLQRFCRRTANEFILKAVSDEQKALRFVDTKLVSSWKSFSFSLELPSSTFHQWDILPGESARPYV